jgi:hypothetical protein
MWPFRRKTVPMPSRQESLSARPVRLVEPDSEPTADGGARLKVRIRDSRWSRLFRLPDGAVKTFELDSIGYGVWNQIDGRTSVKQMIHQLASQVFLRTLIKKGLVGVPMRKPD